MLLNTCFHGTTTLSNTDDTLRQLNRYGLLLSAPVRTVLRPPLLPAARRALLLSTVRRDAPINDSMLPADSLLPTTSLPWARMPASVPAT